MGVIRIKKGLNLPINGEPSNTIDESKTVKKVALLGNDYIGLKPTLAVNIGDKVKLGQLLFTDKKLPGVNFTSPGAGTVVEINRGEKRHFLSMVIELSGSEEVIFKHYSESEIPSLKSDVIKEQLINSGLWTSLRERPFSKVANPEISPKAIFVTAIDSNPLAPSVEKIISGKESSFKNGLRLLSKLTEGNLYLCKEEGENIPDTQIHNLRVEEFSGVHPKGLAGTHIHFLDPANRNKKVWYINAQDVIDIGLLFTTGKINVERIISLAGPSIKNPRYLKTRIGAAISDLTENELSEGDCRVISGSVLSGRKSSKEEGFLGRYHNQISVIEEQKDRPFLGWITPSSKLFSVKKVLLSSLTPSKKFNFSTAMNGGERAIVPSGSYEKVMPLDILPTFLLRALAVNDVEDAEKLGCLELDEEDLALCTFVCPSKIDHGINLRRNLTLIDKEG
ncbi:MAG: Na(+)-translocating NADH-quinone reductase subunit A [Ignavibacteriae bacterium]|nr:Na(+)-translocating NADH-quinone reductase subunit A [Ignavibacteriota bacterium]MCB9259901.1 Na(+)-translocating NADH-quinone reductase subunit A [Ignavibacteriales bacterium]